MLAIYDPETPEYKKALRHHLKTKNSVDTSGWSAFRVQEKRFKTRIPRPSLHDVIDLDALSSSAEDRSALESSMRAAGWTCGSIDAQMTRAITLNSPGKAFLVPQVQGLAVLPGFLTMEEQRNLIRLSLEHQAKHPNETNLDAHYNLPSQGLWNTYVDCFQNPSTDPLIPTRSADSDTDNTNGYSPPSGRPTNSKRTLIDNTPASISDFPTILSTPKPPPDPSFKLSPIPISKILYKLRWANIGKSYHWGTKSYDFSKQLGTFPPYVKEICKRAVRSVNWENVWGGEWEESDSGDEIASWGDEEGTWGKWHETYEPDAGIVNFYQEKDTLMGHVDRSELTSTTPLVSISLGNAAIFLIGGVTRDIKPIPLLLRSGDVLIMSGPECRRAYHGVPRILEGTLPDHLGPGAHDDGKDDWAPFAHYLKTTRININVRQVFPTGFKPSQNSVSSC